MLEVGVSGHQNRESLTFGGVEQSAILELGPSALVGGNNLVLREYRPQRNGSALIEEDAHLCWSQGATRRMLQHGTSLFDGDTRKPLDEL